MRFTETLTQALEHLVRQPQDEITVELARGYARALDEGADIAKLGPLFQSCLETLLMSPKARVTVLKGKAGDDNGARTKLDELRARRARRDGSEAVDSPAS